MTVACTNATDTTSCSTNLAATSLRTEGNPIFGGFIKFGKAHVENFERSVIVNDPGIRLIASRDPIDSVWFNLVRAPSRRVVLRTHRWPNVATDVSCGFACSLMTSRLRSSLLLNELALGVSLRAPIFRLLH